MLNRGFQFCFLNFLMTEERYKIMICIFIFNAFSSESNKKFMNFKEEG